MIKLPLLLLQACTIILINIDMFVPILAKKPFNVDDGFLVENHRTRRKENYLLQRALSNDLENDNTAMTYATEPFDPNTNPDELPALIVDYANMIRNDIILLDNSVETRTSKRGNVKVQRRNKEDTLDVRCTCEQENLWCNLTINREPIPLGDNYFPKIIETTKCNKTLCPFPYGCQKRYHNITVLRTKNYPHEESEEKVPLYFRNRWVAVKKAVVVGCYCTREHTDYINTNY